VPTPAEYKKQWKQLKKLEKERQEYKTKTLKELQDGTYVHPQHLILDGITESDIKRMVGFTNS
jgi:hypothetical protein